jgi:hypothetical protein
MSSSVSNYFSTKDATKIQLIFIPQHQMATFLMLQPHFQQVEAITSFTYNLSLPRRDDRK